MAETIEADLPTEPAFYLGNGGNVWELDHAGGWWFHARPGFRHPTPNQRDRTAFDARTFGWPMVKLVPARSDAANG